MHKSLAKLNKYIYIVSIEKRAVKMGAFAKNTIYLAVVHYIAATIGFFYRLYLANTIGPVGMGLYEQALSFLQVAITLMTAGVPSAISKLVAEANMREKNMDVKNVMTSAMLLIICFFIFGIILFTLLSVFLRSKLFILILPTAIFIGFSSIINGFFLGIQQTYPLVCSILIDNITTFVFFYL